MRMPCSRNNADACLSSQEDQVDSKPVSRTARLTGAIFLTSVANSCASYLAAGRVAFSVGLHSQKVLRTAEHPILTLDSMCRGITGALWPICFDSAVLLASSLDLILDWLLISTLIDGLLHEKENGRPNAYRSDKGKPDVRQLKILAILVVRQHRH